jgi:type II secretory pathway component PulM
VFETLNTVLKNLEKNIAARGKGERAVLLALALIILVGGGYIAVIEPALLRIDVARAEKLQAESQLSGVQASFASMLELREQDPNETSRARLMVLTREQERIDAEIAGLASDLISPVAMTELLISMLDKQEGLRPRKF